MPKDIGEPCFGGGFDIPEISKSLNIEEVPQNFDIEDSVRLDGFDMEDCVRLNDFDTEDSDSPNAFDMGEEPRSTQENQYESKQNDNGDIRQETRELSDEEIKTYSKKLGWPEEKVKNKCTIDENGTLHMKTDCEHLEGKEGGNGVPYKRKTIEINGVKIQGVFPEFNSEYDYILNEADEKRSSVKQFNECNKALQKSVESDSKLRAKFTENQLEDIKNGRTPRGYTWHHNEEQGKMQLVKTKDHDRAQGGAAHTGGNSIWGNKSSG